MVTVDGFQGCYFDELNKKSEHLNLVSTICETLCAILNSNANYECQSAVGDQNQTSLAVAIGCPPQNAPRS